MRREGGSIRPHFDGSSSLRGGASQLLFIVDSFGRPGGACTYTVVP